jgi:heme-degrading monooxygenase HmoA
MHARMSRFAGLPAERIEATLQQFGDDGLAALEQQPGFEGITVLVDYRAGKAAAISFWDSQDSMRQSEKAAALARDQAVETGGPERDPVVDHYEVVLTRWTEGAGARAES